MLDLAKIENLHTIPNILKTLAARSGSILNERDLARTANVPITTTRRYLQLLQNLSLITFVPGWFRNLEKRVIKAPKVYLADTALLMHLLQVDQKQIQDNPSQFGHIVENFVLLEIIKQLSWSHTISSIYHYRTYNGSEEVDFVLENSSGKIIGIEVKATETITSKDFNGLKALQAQMGNKFLRGILLYIGSKALPFAPNLVAVPISTLWQRF